jgi:UPF0755 protein
MMPVRRGVVVLASVLLLVAVAALAVMLWVHDYANSPLPLNEPSILVVAPGSSLTAVARDLHARGIIARPRVWVVYARAHGLAHRIKAGEYEIQPGTSAAGILQKLVKGDVVLHAITIVEGWAFRDMMRTIREHPAIQHSLSGVGAAEMMARLGSSGVHPEGQFFPDTYRFAAGTSDLEILRQAHARLRERLQAAWDARAPDLPLANEYQALILASIVEKETGLASERPRIAGVFVRRLRIGMRLQSDPTVIYGIGAAYDGDIRSRDLDTDTPYNTYTRRGLPPTPIALPGEAALRAVTRPDDSGALFFVATGEADGSHHFSATLAEHNAAVKRFLARQRARAATADSARTGEDAR